MGTLTCYRCGGQLATEDRVSIIVLRLLEMSSERNFGQYDYCGACARIIAAAMGLHILERDALQLLD